MGGGQGWCEKRQKRLSNLQGLYVVVMEDSGTLRELQVLVRAAFNLLLELMGQEMKAGVLVQFPASTNVINHQVERDIVFKMALILLTARGFH